MLIRKILFCCSFLITSSVLLFAEKRPNILLAFADDWGQHASIYAEVDGKGGVNDVISTPNFDKLAKDGVLFRNAFVSSPSCTPCRSSLLSGLHFWQTGTASILQGATWDSSLPAYPLIMRDNGYQIGKTAKVWGPGTPKDAPYGENKYAYDKHGGFNGYSQNAYKLLEKGKSVAEAKEEVLNYARMCFQAFLNNRDKTKPFCYWFGPTNVHRKWIKGSGKKLWDIDPDNLKGKMPPFLPDVHAIREDLADYFGEAQAFDLMLGMLIEELKKSGEFENTIIAVSGDHGAPGFPQGKCNLYDFGSKVCLAISGPGVSKGLVLDDFVSLPDLAPTFLEAGKVSIPSEMSARSLWPSLKAKQSGMADAKRTHVFIGRERHVYLSRKGNLPYPQRAIRSKDYLYIINFKPERYPMGDPYLLGTDKEPSAEQLTQTTFITLADEDAGPTKAWLVKNREAYKEAYDNAYGKRPREELYDLSKDPHQMNNLAENIEYKKVKSKLNQQLMSELQRTNDPRLVDDGKLYEVDLINSTGKKKKKK